MTDDPIPFEYDRETLPITVVGTGNCAPSYTLEEQALLYIEAHSGVTIESLAKHLEITGFEAYGILTSLLREGEVEFDE